MRKVVSGSASVLSGRLAEAHKGPGRLAWQPAGPVTDPHDFAQRRDVTGIRRARYLGLPKTRLEHNAAAAAINLIRLDAWWTRKPLDWTRTTHLQRLHLTTAA